MKRSSLSGSRTLLYGPSVEYTDPVTSSRCVLPPASYQPRKHEIGDAVTVVRDPATGEVRLPLPDPRAQMAMPFVFAALVLALGAADLSE